MNRILALLSLILLIGATAQAQDGESVNQKASQKSAPKLILQITVDQLRGDLPRRYLRKMGPGGFRYLLENGVIYENAHHAACQHGDHRWPCNAGNRRVSVGARSDRQCLAGPSDGRDEVQHRGRHATRC